jgi:4-aminobutyrate aminotransferase-like enzyme
MEEIFKINAFDSLNASGLDTDKLELIRRRERSLGSNTLLFYKNPIHFERGSGVWLFDQRGQAYLDAYNNVPQIGHCHPAVASAVAEQMSQLNINTRYLSPVVYDYTEKLLATFPGTLSRISLTNSGTESVDLAMRIAQKYTGGTGYIVTHFAYHGNSMAVSAISPSVGVDVPVGRDVRAVEPPDSYRSPGVDIGAAFAQSVSAAIAKMQRHGIRLAAMVVDTVFSSDGVFVDPPGFLREAVDVVHEAGGLVIVDEVQPGLGRTGSHMWGFERHDIVPDIVVLGKPMGNGIPMGGVVAKPDILDAFMKTGYFNTFGGNLVSCAAGSVVLDVLKNERLLENAADVGAYFIGELRSLALRKEVIGDVRGTGLFISVEFVKDRIAREPDSTTCRLVLEGMREHRILVGGTGRFSNMLKIRPPLPFSKDNVDLFVSTLDAVLSGLKVSA